LLISSDLADIDINLTNTDKRIYPSFGAILLKSACLIDKFQIDMLERSRRKANHSMQNLNALALLVLTLSFDYFTERLRAPRPAFRTASVDADSATCRN
jgi:hypothetical protein